MHVPQRRSKAPAKRKTKKATATVPVRRALTPRTAARSGRPAADVTLTLGAAARELGLGLSTLRERAERGDIATHRTPGGHRRVKLADLLAYKRQLFEDVADTVMNSKSRAARRVAA